MKQGTAFATQLKRAWTKHRKASEAPAVPEPCDPIRALATGVLGVGAAADQAERAVDRLLGAMVDWNEVRVSNAFEIQDAIGDTVPDSLEQCQRLRSVIQAVYDRENRISLDRLASMGRRDARHYLEKLQGADEYAVAHVVLWALGGHAVPVNDHLLTALRDAKLVHPAATRAEVQAFLERHIAANDAKEFVILMRTFTPTKASGKKASSKTTKRASKKTAKKTSAKKTSGKKTSSKKTRKTKRAAT